MNSLYIIRDTLNNPPLAANLAVLIKSQLPHVDVRIVSAQAQKKALNRLVLGKIINLDPFSRFKDHVSLDISRLFLPGEQKTAVGYRSRLTNLNIDQQIALIPPGIYSLVDDDICSGGTVGYICQKIKEINSDVHISQKVSLIHEFIPELKSGQCLMFDTIDTHDFTWGSIYSGLLVDCSGVISRKLYIDPVVNLATRAKIPNPSLFREGFSRLMGSNLVVSV